MCHKVKNSRKLTDSLVNSGFVIICDWLMLAQLITDALTFTVFKGTKTYKGNFKKCYGVKFDKSIANLLRGRENKTWKTRWLVQKVQVKEYGDDNENMDEDRV